LVCAVQPRTFTKSPKAGRQEVSMWSASWSLFKHWHWLGRSVLGAIRT
jgi:hypothetical protein